MMGPLLDKLEAFHGKQEPGWPTDPYLFIVWWHCGYPASDAACAKGWAALKREIGVEPAKLLAADPRKMAAALKAGGMVPEKRAMRLKEIAGKAPMLKGISRAVLKTFPNIADPGADRILLFGGIAPVAAVPSNCPHVLVRIRLGLERENYSVTYKEAQKLISDGVAENFDARKRAYLLLKAHGQRVCKTTNPKCGECPVTGECGYFGGKTRGRSGGD
jgi:endonuclease-3